MALTEIADLWTPAVWIQGANEKARAFPSLMNSSAVVRSPLLDSIAAGPGVSANVPFFKDVSDDADGIQVENSAPTPKEITSGTQICTILNRVIAYNNTGLSAAVAGAEPVDAILSMIGPRRMKGQQSTAIATLRGAFGGGDDASGSASELTSMRVEAFSETGANPPDSNKMSADLFIVAKALLGEFADNLAGGAILTHPNIVAQLEILDKESFKDGVESGLGFTVRTYKGIPIFTSRLLVRAGTVSGYVYETYVLSAGVLAVGFKPQGSAVGEVAALQLDLTQISTNNIALYDRTRYLVHLNGMKWVGTAAGQSATDAELADIANWDLAYSSADRVGGVLIRTNG